MECRTGGFPARSPNQRDIPNNSPHSRNIWSEQEPQESASRARGTQTGEWLDKDTHSPWRNVRRRAGTGSWARKESAGSEQRFPLAPKGLPPPCRQTFPCNTAFSPIGRTGKRKSRKDPARILRIVPTSPAFERSRIQACPSTLR